MAVGKAKNSEPIKNNNGTVKSLGNLTLSTVPNGHYVYDPTRQGPHFGATYLANDDFVRLSIANTNNDHYRNQLIDYSAHPSGIDYVTGIPNGYVTNIADFTLASGRPDNVHNFWYFIGEPQKVTGDDHLTFPVTYQWGLVSSSYESEFGLRYVTRNTNEATSASLFTGSASTTNEFHEKTFTVNFNGASGPISTANYTLDAWKKLNFNLPVGTTEIEIYTSNDTGEPFSVGLGSGLTQASTQTRTVSVSSSTRVSPITYVPTTQTLTLVSGEKAIRVPCTSGALQLTIREMDDAGALSDPTHYIVPNESVGTYYPIYQKVCIAENQGKPFTIQVLA